MKITAISLFLTVFYTIIIKINSFLYFFFFTKSHLFKNKFKPRVKATVIIIYNQNEPPEAALQIAYCL